MRIIVAILLAVLSFPPLLCRAEAERELLKVVVLSRHGVRAPTQDAKILNAWSMKEWPKWPVERGDLTPRGAELVQAMWANLRHKFDAYGMMQANTCPAIYVRADVDERTKATAQAILDGFAPGCNLQFEVFSGKVDPLFHPVKAGLYHYNAITVATDVLAQTHGGLERLLDQFSGPMSLLNSINGPASPKLCAHFGLDSQCQITDMPNAISVSPDGTGIKIVGGLGVASSMAEIFLLEYAQWPDATPGWGSVTPKVLGQLLPIHAGVFDVVNRAWVVAWANGSALLREMTAALLGEHKEKAINDARVVVFVGHDTNIANVGGLLKVTWQEKGYPANGIPPASALFLELWRINGVLQVIPRFFAQPFAALRTPLSQDLKSMPIEDLERFAPAGVAVHRADGLNQYRPEELKKLVQKLTSGAPMPGEKPIEKERFEFDEAG